LLSHVASWGIPLPALKRGRIRRVGLLDRQAELRHDNPMIYTLTVECVEGAYWKERCVRVIEIDEHSSLHSLHLAIQDAVKFDNDHLYDFYAGRYPRHRKMLFAESEDWEERENDYCKIELNQVYPLPKLKLYYLFDYGDNWLFEIKKGRKETQAEAKVSYPRVVQRIGPNPEQYPRFR